MRWEKFFDAVIDAFDAGEPFTNSNSTEYVGYTAHGSAPGVEGRALQFDKDIWDFACEWAHIKE